MSNDTTIASCDVELASLIQAALRASLFESRLMVTPRRLAQLAGATAASFGQYCRGQASAEHIRALGGNLAAEGLGHSSVLVLVELLHRQGDADQRMGAISFCTPLLCGYMAAREAELLRVQERTRLALERARAHAKA